MFPFAGFALGRGRPLTPIVWKSPKGLLLLKGNSLDRRIDEVVVTDVRESVGGADIPVAFFGGDSARS